MDKRIKLAGGVEAKIGNPERSDFDDNLGGAVQYALAKVVVFVLETLGEGLGALLGSGLVSFLEHIEPHLVEYYSPIIEQIKQIDGIPLWFKDFLDKMQHPESEAGAAVAQAVLGSAAGGITGSLLGVLLSPLTYGANDLIRPARPVLPDLMAMEWRNLLDSATLDDWANDQGWPDIAVDAYREALRPRPSGPDLMAWAWRVHQDPEVVRDELAKRGYLTADIDKFMELAKRLPGPGDLVTFALREVWKEEFRPELLDPNAPPRYYELMLKQGFSREFAEDYWASHWRLPGVGQGFEMFWRLPEFTEDDLRQLLTRLDILPRYHDELIQIAYHPYTRVDVRRMHDVGVVSDDELLTAYKDLGFDDEKAGKMADFTIAYNRRTDDEFTKTEILDGYKSGMLGIQDAVNLLISIGKSEDYAWYVIALQEYKRQKSLVTEKVRHIKTLYVNGERDRTGATTLLAALDLEAERISRYIEEWDIARTAKIARPTLAKVEEYYKEDIIDEETARRELTKRRYPGYAIEWAIRDWDTQIVEAARVEAERAQKEEERVVKAKFRDDRLVAMAHKNAEIANLNLLIAEIKLAMFYMPLREEYAVIQERMAELWEIYWQQETDEERAVIEEQMDILAEQAGVLDADITNAKESILIAKRDIRIIQLEKARLPVVP